MKDSLKIVVSLILGALLVILYMQKCSGVKVSKESAANIYAALSDSLKYYKNKSGNTTARISVLETEKAKHFLVLQTKDVTVQQLQQVVKDYKDKLTKGSSVTLGLIETVNKMTQITQIVKRDTIRVIDPNGYTDNFIYPTYRDSLRNEWIDYAAQMNKDTATLDLKISNKFSIIVGKDKKGPFADITTYNPYSAVKTSRTYQVAQPRPKKFGIGASSGVTYYNDKARPYIGIGLNYNIIRF